MDDQIMIHKNVARRGYLVGYNGAQIRARQAVKAFEELAEALHEVDFDDGPLSGEWSAFRDEAVALGGAARRLFDKKQAWSQQPVRITPDFVLELADVQVVLAVAATESGAVDIMALALRKSADDISRGVR